MNQRLENLEPGQNEEILKLHTAEYTALMARSTAMLTVTFTVMTIGFVYLGAIIAAWPGRLYDSRRQLLWGCLLPEQVIILFWLFLLRSMYGITRYIEQDLRGLCRQAANGFAHFWRYEHSWHGESKRLYNLPEWLPLATSGLAFIGVFCYRKFALELPRTETEYIAAVASLLLFALAIPPTIRLRKMRQEWTKWPGLPPAPSPTSPAMPSKPKTEDPGPPAS